MGTQKDIRWPINDADRSYISEIERIGWQSDRAFDEYPTLTVYQRTYTNVDAVAGTATETLTPQFSDIPASYMPIPDDLVAASGGILQPGAVRVACYDLGSEIDVRSVLELLVGSAKRRFVIRSQVWYRLSGRSEFVLNPYSERVPA